ncbi:hypothetical protein BDV98DRAFT_522070 [Pterulicium gracile]|uniref:Uncharacterized protein n=1 Tax=Pterulicium gracile TaxID=1884261 RepID=A0A5C3QX37_9AGAR|nr:hypothetical protein BDV98DRAFT_522070 [Pterula gracilis]
MASSSNSKFASTFAPYTPPPDDPTHQHHQQQPSANTNSSRFSAPIRPWFPHSQSSIAADSSYQSGAVPTFSASQSAGPSTAPETENRWATSSHLRVDMLAAFAYILGPISALLLLIFETENDYVRFHAYQSALLTTPLLAIRILVSLMRFYAVLRYLFTLLLVIPSLYMAFRAYTDASRNGLSYFQLPYIGPIAEQWLHDE